MLRSISWKGETKGLSISRVTEFPLIKCFLRRKVFLALLNLEWLCISRSMSGKALNKTLDSNRDTVYASRFTLRVLFCKISDAWVHPSTRSKICFWRKTDLRDLNTSQAAQNFVWLSINYLYHLLKSWFSWVVAIKAAWKWDIATDCLDPQNPVHLWLTNNFYDKSYCPQWMISDKLPPPKTHGRGSDRGPVLLPTMARPARENPINSFLKIAHVTSFVHRWGSAEISVEQRQKAQKKEGARDKKHAYISTNKNLVWCFGSEIKHA